MNLRIKEIRESKNLSKTDVAKLISVSLPTYIMWENDKRTIPTSRLFQLANIFEVNIDYMVSLTNIKINRKNINANLNLKNIAIHLKEIRNELNFSLRDVQQMLGIPHSRWDNYESGKYLISSWILIHMCEKSGISIDYVLERSNLKYLKDLL